MAATRTDARPASCDEIAMNGTAAFFALAVTIFYWWQNIKGIEESSDRALDVMKITTVMVVILLIWGVYSADPHRRAPSAISNSCKSALQCLDALGVFRHTKFASALGLFGVIIAFGHSVLAMSGEESLAQVNREIEHPKLKNLKRAAIVIAVYSCLFTGMASMLAVMLIPDAVRVPIYRDNIISGMAMYMVGPQVLRIIFRVFVVVVGFLILSGAINTSMIGSTGVLMRVAEDGVLTDWFRKPHRRFGTSYRIVNMVAILQIVTIVASRGNVITLGEAYAFGVIWSFTFNSLAMLVLRNKYKGERGWKVPPNIRIGKIEIPLGLASVFMVLISTAIVNFFTKEVATVTGVGFAATFFFIFSFSEHKNKKRHALAAKQMKEHFQLEHEDTVVRETLKIKPGSVMVTMRDSANPAALKWALAEPTPMSRTSWCSPPACWARAAESSLKPLSSCSVNTNRWCSRKQSPLQRVLENIFLCWLFRQEISLLRWCRPRIHWKRCCSFGTFESNDSTGSGIPCRSGVGNICRIPNASSHFLLFHPMAKLRHSTLDRTFRPCRRMTYNSCTVSG